MIEYKSFTDFPRGTMYAILKDAYSYDFRNKEVWNENWKESVGFSLYDRKENKTESAYNGDYLYYEIIL